MREATFPHWDMSLAMRTAYSAGWHIVRGFYSRDFAGQPVIRIFYVEKSNV